MSTNSCIRHRIVVIALGLVLGASGAEAQSGRGTISGLVSDPSESAVPLANVVATEQDTGVVTATRSGEHGLYSLLNLPPGLYTVTFTAPGFAPFARKGIRVGVQSAVALDVTLSVGDLRDSITVEADATALEARNAEIGTALSNATVTALPLSITGGRSLENFAYAVVPGVEGNNWASNIVGAAPFTKEVILDGTSATIQIQGHISESSPPMEAVEEFKVETSGFPAEYGRTGGGLFNFTLRSGTNAYHGTAYGQFRNEALNANTWINNQLAEANPANAAQYEKPRDRQNLAGASLGGPIMTGRTFFFAAFEEYHQSRDQLGPFDRTVPTPAFLNGDFSALLDTTTRLGTDAGGRPIYKGAILDPRTGLVFPGNLIPASRISPVSRRIADIYRQSYAPMLAGVLSNNSAGPAYIDPEFRQHQFSLKLDHNITSGSRLSGSFITTVRPRTIADQGGVWDPDGDMGGPLSKAREQKVTTYQGRVGYNQVLSPEMLHEASLTFNRFRNPSLSGSFDGNWPGQLGLNVPGAYGTFPQINFGDVVNGVGETAIGYGISDYYVADTYQIADSVSWVKGRHVFKFGGDLRFIQMNSHGDRAFLSYNFSPAQTGVLGGPFANQVGFGFASFLLGDVASASMNVPSDLYGRRDYQALFAQDDFRLTERLTLNLGLRWETTGGWREKYGHWANFNIDDLNPVTGVRGVVEYADEQQGSFEGKRDFREFGPRVGAAYRPTDRLVVRGAYGVLYAPIGVNYWQGVPYGFAPGFVGTNTVLPTGSTAPAFNWDQSAYPGTPAPATKSPAYSQWGMVSISPESLKAGRIQQWSAGVEYELEHDLVVGAQYLANRGTRLQSGDFERNQPDPQAMRQLLLAGTEWNWVADAGSAAAAGVSYPYAGFAGPAWMAITPYPQAAAAYGPLFFVGSPLGQSDYKALQLSANKRMSRGIAASISYTLSRQRGDMDSGFQERWWTGPIQDVTTLDREAAVIGANDRTHVLKGFVTWSPAGGWTVSALVRYESGLPLPITSSNFYAGWMYPIYVNRNPDVSLSSSFDAGRFDPLNPSSPANQYFNPKAFSNPAYGSLGNGPGRFEELRGFGGAYEDLSVMKSLAFGRSALQFKVDVLNLFNRHYLANPVTDISSPLFGSVTSAGSQQPRQIQIGVRYQW
jgi:Carboxypeptidase regulatory-like domain/TonB dependent receptor-like, beta-barrel